METSNSKRFAVNKLSDAAYLQGVKQIRCIELQVDPTNESRVLFIFAIDPTEGQQLVLEFGCSEAFKFDASVKELKGKLFAKIRKAKPQQNQ